MSSSAIPAQSDGTAAAPGVPAATHSASVQGARARTATARAGQRVVDAPIRMFHALFGLSFVGAYLTADGEQWRAMHITLGYTMLGLLALRVVYGFFGPPTARLSTLRRRLSGVREWLLQPLRADALRLPGEPWWRSGQNFAMAMAVAALLIISLPLTLTGIAADASLAESLLGEGFAELHEAMGEAMLWLVFAHLGLVLGLSVLRRRNLALPMWNGRINRKGPDLVRHDRTWLAALMLLAALAWGGWQWSQSPSGLIPIDGPFSSAQHHDD